MGKPNALPLTDHAFETAETLRLAAEQEGDLLLLPLLRYEEMMQDVRQTFQACTKSKSHCQLYTQVDSMMATLEQWKSTDHGMLSNNLLPSQQLTQSKSVLEQIFGCKDTNLRDGLALPFPD